MEYVGRGMGRCEGLEKAEGKAKYAADFYEDGMLTAALVRSTIPHGYIKNMDFSLLPEDILYFTGSDFAENIIEDVINDQPVLADKKVRFMGEPVAIIAGENREKVYESLKLVKIEYEPLPVIKDVYAALDKSLVPVHEAGNLLLEFENEKGSVEKGFAESDLILEDDFYTPVQDHGYMEPEACFAKTDENGKLYLYTSTQNVFHDKRMAMRALGLKDSEICVRAAAVGGGFGGKDGNTAQLFAALVAWKTKKPAKIVFSREESLSCSYKRHACNMHVKIGFKKDGTMLAFDGSGLLDTGAYAGLGPAVLGLFSEHFAGPYVTPNVKIHSRLLYTNKPVSHAMRGFGAPQGAFATEQLISRAAKKLGIDPVDIRIKNALTDGAVAALGQKMEHCVGYKEALKIIKESDFWKSREKNTDPYVGYGIAGGHLSCGLGKNIPDSAEVTVEEKDGRFVIRIGFVDIGQGSRTALLAMAADALETDIKNIDLYMADTDETLDCGSTAGSRSTFIAGNALLGATESYKKERVKNKVYSFKADFPESGTAFPSAGFPHAMYTYIAQAVKLRIDPVTGMIRLLDIFAVTEAGRIINPLSMAGQIQGGVAMSVGYALGENCVFENGVLKNDSFSSYLMPTAMDISHISNSNVKSYENSGPMGVKGAAEVSTVSIAPAIGAAVSEISNVQLNSLPFDIKKILYSINP